MASDPNKRSSTAARDRQALDHFLPGKALDAVSPGDVQQIVGRLARSQAPATDRRNVSTFTTLMKAAVEADLTGDLQVRAERRRIQYIRDIERSVEVAEPSRLDISVLESVAQSSGALILDTTNLPPKAVYERAIDELEHRLRQPPPRGDDLR